MHLALKQNKHLSSNKKQKPVTEHDRITQNKQRLKVYSLNVFLPQNDYMVIQCLSL